MPRGPLEAASKELSCAQAPRHSLSCANHVAQCVTRPTESTSRTKLSMRILSFPFDNHPFKKHPLNIHPFKIQPLNIHPSRYNHSTSILQDTSTQHLPIQEASSQQQSEA